MELTNTIILAVGALLFVSILASKLSSRLGLPLLLIFLVLGMLVGENGPGGIQFDDFQTSFLIGNIALAIILLDGGLRTNFNTFRVALYPAISLATVGVLLTAGLVAIFAVYILGIDWKYSLLLGAIVGSTDAAAVFSLLRQNRIRLSTRMQATLEIESGANDPMAVFLVISVFAWFAVGAQLTVIQLLWNFIHHFSVGVIAGISGGLLLTAILNKLRLAEELNALLIFSGGLALFAMTNMLGGSGFMAIYLAGVFIGNKSNIATKEMFSIMDTFAWLSQAGMFFVLGLLVTPSKLLLDLPSAAAIAAFLMLIARPIAIWLSLLPFRFAAKEVCFIGWVGLRGAVPIVLAMFPIMNGTEHSFLFFHVAFVVVLMSLLIQGTTVAWSARLCQVSIQDERK